MLKIKVILILIVLGFFSQNAFSNSEKKCGVDGKICVEYGAEVFQQRCALCHGSDGLGEGILSLSIKGYPSTNLLKPKITNSKEKLLEVIRLGGRLNSLSNEMPPWGDELTHTQLESVASFVVFLRSNLKDALVLLKSASEKQKPTIKLGRGIYKGRCKLCHGGSGEGDGKMARIIKTPPPFNLTLSRTPDEYLHKIITLGGEKMGRSNRMPPWGGDLTESEIKSVILFIKTLRRDP